VSRRPAPRPEEFTFWTEEKVRVSDTDLNGHVNNAAYAAYFESARAELLTAVAGAPAEREFGLALARVTIEYRQEVHYPARLRIGSAVVAIGTTSLTIAHALFLAEACAATAASVFVLLDRATRRPRPVDEALRMRFLALAPPAPARGAVEVPGRLD